MDPPSHRQSPSTSVSTTSRRRFLVATGSVAIPGLTAGCYTDGAGGSRIVVYNVTADPTTVSIEVVPESDDVSGLDRTLELDPRERIEIPEEFVFPLITDYSVTVDVEGGPRETFDWTESAADRAPLYVLLDGSDNIRFLVEVG